MPPSPSRRSSLYGPIRASGRAPGSGAISGCDRKSSPSSSSASSPARSSASCGSSSRSEARLRSRVGGSSSSSASSSGDSRCQRSASTRRQPALSLSPAVFIALQRRQQEQLGLLPVAADAALGAVEQGGDLHLRQAGEVAQLDHARQALVHRRQLGQGGEIGRAHV